jgi:hypothetical protein
MLGVAHVQVVPMRTKKFAGVVCQDPFVRMSLVAQTTSTSDLKPLQTNARILWLWQVASFGFLWVIAACMIMKWFGCSTPTLCPLTVSHFQPTLKMA